MADVVVRSGFDPAVAELLLDAADTLDLDVREVRTVSDGYLVPVEVLTEAGLDCNGDEIVEAP